MLGIVVGLAAEARIARGLGGQVMIGGGTTAGAAGAAHRLVAEGATALLSFGLAGGLDPALPAGTVVIPGAVIDQFDNRWTTDPALSAMLDLRQRQQFLTLPPSPCGRGWGRGAARRVVGMATPPPGLLPQGEEKYSNQHPMPLASVGRSSNGSGTTLLASASVIATALQKQALWNQFCASAADMESGAVASVAQQAGLPFAVLRAICDPADANLPPAALTALDANGRISAGSLLRSLIRRPSQIPSLIRLGLQAAQARAALLRHVARCSSLGLPPRS